MGFDLATRYGDYMGRKAFVDAWRAHYKVEIERAIEKERR